MRKRSRGNLLIFCGESRENADAEAWLPRNHDPSIGCKPCPTLMEFTRLNPSQAVSTNDCHIIASGSNDSQPDIVVWERVVSRALKFWNANLFISLNALDQTTAEKRLKTSLQRRDRAFDNQFIGGNYIGFGCWAGPQSERCYDSSKCWIYDRERIQRAHWSQEANRFLRYPSSKRSEFDVPRAAGILAQENSRLSLERSKALLREQGIDIDNPHWRDYLESLD